MFVEIITPEKTIFKGEVQLAQLPGSKGGFEILKNHAPIISTLEKGRIKIIDLKEKEHFFDQKNNVIENKANKIIILIKSV